MNAPEDRSRGGSNLRIGDDSSDVGQFRAELRTFLIADIRGYTRFTQARGDEAAGLLAARFSEFVRRGVEARDGTLLELRSHDLPDRRRVSAGAQRDYASVEPSEVEPAEGAKSRATTEHDRTAGIFSRVHSPSRSDELSGDGERNFCGCLGPDVEPHGCRDAVNLLLCDTSLEQEPAAALPGSP